MVAPCYWLVNFWRCHRYPRPVVVFIIATVEEKRKGKKRIYCGFSSICPGHSRTGVVINIWSQTPGRLVHIPKKKYAASKFELVLTWLRLSSWLVVVLMISRALIAYKDCPNFVSRTKQAWILNSENDLVSYNYYYYKPLRDQFLKVLEYSAV